MLDIINGQSVGFVSDIDIYKPCTCTPNSIFLWAVFQNNNIQTKGITSILTITFNNHNFLFLLCSVSRKWTFIPTLIGDRGILHEDTSIRRFYTATTSAEPFKCHSTDWHWFPC